MISNQLYSVVLNTQQLKPDKPLALGIVNMPIGRGRCSNGCSSPTQVSLHSFLGAENEQAADNASENDSKEANSKDNSDEELDGFQVVDSWEDRDEDVQQSRKKKAVAQETDKPVDDEEVPAKKKKLVDVESEDSDDDFAAQLLEGQLESLAKYEMVHCKWGQWRGGGGWW